MTRRILGEASDLRSALAERFVGKPIVEMDAAIRVARALLMAEAEAGRNEDKAKLANGLLRRLSGRTVKTLRT